MNRLQLTHVVAALGVLSRIADVVSTRLVSPTLALEGNALMRRVGWKGAWATVLAGLVAYWSVEVGIMFTTASFLVAGSNLMRGWFTRFLGELEVERLMIAAARRGRRRVAITFVCSGGACVIAAGALTMWLSGPAQWGFYSGFGILAYGAAIAIHGSSSTVRLFKKAQKTDNSSSLQSSLQ